MKLNLEILDAHYIYEKDTIEELDMKRIVPKMMVRRRLTQNAKILLYLADKIASNQERIIFGSAYGELPVTSKILNAIYNEEQISPTDFQNSVYNTAVSYLSLLSNNTNEIMTVSNGDKTSKNVLQSAAIKAMDGDEIVLFCVETLNIDGIDDVNNCIDYLESGVALKVKITQNDADIKIDETNSLKLPQSIVAMVNVADAFLHHNKKYLEVEL